MAREGPQQLSPAAVATAVLLSAMWGLNIVGIKVSLAAFSPIWSAFWRLLAGWPFLWIWARTGRVRLKLDPGEPRLLALLAALFTLQIGMLNTSIGWTSAAFAAVLLNTAPVFINFIAHFAVPEDRLSAGRVMGLALACAGVAVALLGRPDVSLAPRPVLGNALATVTAAVIASRMVYTQRLVQTISPIKVMFWQCGLSVPMFLAWAALTEPMLVGPLTTGPILAWLYCSVGIVGVAFVLWTRLLQSNSPGLISVFVFPTPLFGVLFSAMIYGESLSAELVIGVIGVAFGILVVSLDRRREALRAERKARSAARPSWEPEPGET